jgi:hypothetical protein
MTSPPGSRPVLTTANCLAIIPVTNVKSGTPVRHGGSRR